ncbi:MAG: phosphate-starvation-inducible PsiE family protein [Gammaproteobacteria bacterium]|nr:phosphate-starvation-inducible PsiE family protein [Gammaproteobacteria bacterium]
MLLKKFIPDSKQLHWTTEISEKVLLGTIGTATLVAAVQYIWVMFDNRTVELADLFMLFIFAEVIGMVGAFYSTHRIPVTLPIIIAMTALCRLIVLHSKEMEPLTLLAEAFAILILASASYLMSLKDKLSLEKIVLRRQAEE